MKKPFLFLTSAAACLAGALRLGRRRRLSSSASDSRNSGAFSDEEQRVIAEIKYRLDDARNRLKATIEPPLEGSRPVDNE